MRHNVYGKQLGRTKNERTALFRNLVQSLILEEKIETTDAKAKAIKGLVDRIITQAKSPSTHKLVSQFLTHKNVQNKLINEIVPKVQGRNSGYTSVVRLGRRQGDNTLIVRMELLLEDKVKSTKPTLIKEDTQSVAAPKADKPRVEVRKRNAPAKKEAK